MSIEVKQISKNFGNFKALKDVSLKVETGELLALLGPSGSGKTTLLRIIAGLDSGESGEILFHGKDAQDRHAKDREVGFVFQHYALFRHMTVFENIAFGLRVKPKKIRPSDADIRKKVTELLRLVQLDWVADRYPNQLSGGQRQRIALARALAVEPKVLLLDEPFGSLDAKVRKELRQWLRRFHDDLHITSIFVTHDQEEALEVADRIVIMNEGKIEQVGTPEEVYHHPANPFVLNFLGNVNLYHSRLDDGKKAVFYVRPHDSQVSREARGKNSFKASIRHIHPAGATVKAELTSELMGEVQAEISQEEYRELAIKRGEEIFLTPKKIRIHESESNRFDRVGIVQGGSGI